MTTTQPANWTHLPSQMDPADYDYVGAFDVRQPTLAASALADPGILAGLTDEAIASIRQGEEFARNYRRQLEGLLTASPSSRYGSDRDGQCDHCGAWLRYVEVWTHRPSGEHIAVGETCGAERFGLNDRAAFEVSKLRDAAAKARATLAAGGRRAKALEDPELARLVAWGTIAGEAGLSWGFVDSLLEQFEAKAQLSPKQIAAGLRAVDKIAARAAEAFAPAEVTGFVPAPSGRVALEGTVVSTKVVEGYVGDEFKMLVAVEAEGGTFRVWATIPAAIADAMMADWWASERCHDDGPDSWTVLLKGRRVAFTASLEPKASDPTFAIAKRPAKARLLKAVAP